MPYVGDARGPHPGPRGPRGTWTAASRRSPRRCPWGHLGAAPGSRRGCTRQAGSGRREPPRPKAGGAAGWWPVLRGRESLGQPQGSPGPELDQGGLRRLRFRASGYTAAGDLGTRREAEPGAERGRDKATRLDTFLSTTVPNPTHFKYGLGSRR